MEDSATYETPSYLEKVQCQLPALQLLIHIMDPVPPEARVRLRDGGSTTISSGAD